MADTYTQLCIRLCFSVKTVGSMISEDWCEELKKYINEIIDSRGHKSIFIKTTNTEVHCVLGLNPYMSISDLVRYIKNRSARFINAQKFTYDEFQWQEGYLAFSCDYPEVIKTQNFMPPAKTALEQKVQQSFGNHSLATDYLFDLVF